LTDEQNAILWLHVDEMVFRTMYTRLRDWLVLKQRFSLKCDRRTRYITVEGVDRDSFCIKAVVKHLTYEIGVWRNMMMPL
jgi:hypothetical protein